MALSKTKIDRAGEAIARENYRSDDEWIELDDLFTEFRKQHLQPLSQTTIELQHFLGDLDTRYYIAQRLKRRPQIIRKLRRLSVRLSQLQDIGGARIIVPKNADVDRVFRHISEQIAKKGQFEISRVTDYRESGRDRTGYRALHLILSRGAVALELQIRSRIQHYWAESIERTSVIYGYHLKEEEGDRRILRYFRALSDAFSWLEAGGEAALDTRLEIDSLRETCEGIIRASPRGKVLDSFVNEDVIKTLTQKESRGGRGLNNWIIVFDWNSGSFVSWDIVDRNAANAVDAYVTYERNFPAERGFEVVLIGSSEVATVRETHSHYFGINSYEAILESLDTSIIGFHGRIDLDIGARLILKALYRRRFWGNRVVSTQVLKNHLCKRVLTFDASLAALTSKGLIHNERGISLSLDRGAEIESYL
jgi:ppGpp synthetase/RelA/SpoT-type nucleotidyltranferase